MQGAIERFPRPRSPRGGPDEDAWRLMRGSRATRGFKGSLPGLWMAAPALLAVLAIVAYPLTFATYFSFQKVLPGVPAEFVGLENFASMAGDPAFAEALRTTLIFAVCSAGLSFVAGLGMALLLSRPFPGRGAVAAAIFVPWVFPTVAAATLGRIALFDGVGLLGGLAESLGLGDAEVLVSDPNALLAMAVLVDVWRGAPFVALLLLAGLRTIPPEIHEAARVDGAGAAQRFLRITLPLLKPALLVVLLIRILDAFRVFDLFRVMGDLGISSLSTYVYQNVMLSQVNFGLGNAAAVFVFACALLICLFFVLVLRVQAATGISHSGLSGGDRAPTLGPVSGVRSRLGVLGVLLAALFLTPVAWVVWVSVANAPGDAGAVSGPSLLSFPFVLSAGSLASGLVNSLAISGATTAFTLLLACPAAYALARMELPFSGALLGALLAVAFFPPVALLVPLLVQLRETGLIGTPLAVVVPDVVFFLPFAIWLLTTFFRELPVEIEDAARVDGAGNLQILSRMVVPLAAPGVFATGAFVFVLAWNELIFASTFALSDLVRPVTVVLSDLVAAANVGFAGPLAAASVIAALPPVVLFLVFRRRILAGLTGDALAPADSTVNASSRTVLARRVALWAATAAALLPGVWAASLLVRWGVADIAFPFPLNYGEGPLLDQVVRLASFRNIYPNEISTPPYAISNYPPLFVLVQAPFAWLFGPELWYGRAISFASTLAVAALISLTLHALARDRAASALGGLVFLAVPFVASWASLSRVDMLGLALAWAGLCAVVRRPGGRVVVLAAILLVAAAYTRQTYALAAPLAACVWLLAGGHRREALTLVAWVGGLGLGLMAVLSAVTGGGFFLHTVIANLNEFRWQQVAYHLSNVQGFLAILLACGAVYFVAGLQRRDAAWWFVGSYLVGATATALAIGKIGSDVNYLLELSAALSLAAGALVARYSGRPAPRAAVLLVLALQIVVMAQASQLNHANFREYFFSQREGMARLEEIVASSEKPVLADEQLAMIPRQGRRIPIQPFEFTQLAREGKWDQRPFLTSVEEGSFGAILIFEPPGAAFLVRERWTPEMLDAIQQNYERTETIGFTKVYRPR